MLIRVIHRGKFGIAGWRQQGVVLLLSLIVLVAMSLAAIGLMRSVLTSNRIAANLTFQQSTAQSAGVGIETAIAWLEQKARELKTSNPPVLQNGLFANISAGGAETVNYVSRREDPGPAQAWEDWWQQVLVANKQVNTLPVDAAGNTVAFAIHRLCSASGDPLSGIGCEAPPTANAATQTSSKSSGIKLQVPGQIYYRITVRVQGPRNALSFVQAVVAI
jgi:Tfp pilus assembly protein PilX